MGWFSGVRNSGAQRATILLTLLCAFANPARPEQLPLKLYTTADGLVRDGINRIFRDSHGFLWFATPEGISRFDGYEFANYTADQGLPKGSINDILETRNGDFLFATSDGICLFNPRGVPQPQVMMANDAASSQPISQDRGGQPMFTDYYPSADRSSRYVNVVLEDPDGAIWCGTNHGVYRMESSNGKWTFQFVDLGMPAGPDDNTLVEAMVRDGKGSLWVGTGTALYRRFPEGRVEKYTTEDGLPCNFINTLLVDSEQRVWVGTRCNGLSRLVANILPHHSIVESRYGIKEGLGSTWIASLFESAEGVLWVGTNVGLSKLEKGSEKFTSYTRAEGLSDAEVWALGEDDNGSLWIGTANGGAMKLAQNGFTTYSQRDGLGGPYVSSILADSTGAVCVLTSRASAKQINRFDGQRFTAVWPPFVAKSSWGWNQLSFQDREGEWWFATGHGVYRMPKVERFEQLSQTRFKANYTTKQGLGANDIFRLFEDSHGDIWIGGSPNDSPVLTRWERAGETFHRYGSADGINEAATAFREDAAGNLWIGFWSGALARFTNGRFTFFSQADGSPRGMIRALYLDNQQRLWIGSGRDGLRRIDQPDAEHPRFVNYTTIDGLSSNDIWSITEDRWGRIYVGTGRGMDQLDPRNGHIKHFTTADGLAPGTVVEAFRDSGGNLWFGTAEGLSRLVPRPEPVQKAPPILISGIRIAGTNQRTSVLGESAISDLQLDPQRRDLQIDFIGLDFAPGDVLRYEYKLEGADHEWSAPSLQRSVSYPNLPPGKYRFLVRAINTAGAVSPQPAVVTFRILPPIWQRWWFLTLAALAVGLIGYRIYRYRLAQLLAVERVRTHLASDLHDEIGSNLSLIAMISEVASRKIPQADSQVAAWLDLIANTSRETVDSMSDIVWVVNPNRDSISDLTRRMRRFADETFTAHEIEFRFNAPDNDSVKIGAQTRREVFMIFKEAVNNVARHSLCTRAEINFLIENNWLTLRLTDDGRGFDVSAASDGNGLASMKRRADNLSGRLKITSSAQQGAVIELRVPIDRRRWLSRAR